MKNDQPVAIYRKDYSPFPFLVDSLYLTFQLFDDINGQDKSLWFENNGISSRVPK